MQTLIRGKTLTLVLLAGLIVGCTGMSQEEQGTLTGAAIGTAAGAGIGALAGNAGVGALVGAAAGTVVGNIKGREAQQAQ